jgi:hypothetical protein
VTCDDIRAMLIDAVASQRPVTDAAVLAHIEGCAACRAARDDYETMWRQLGDLATPQPSSDARARFVQRLAGMRRGSTDGLRRRVRAWYATAWAATILMAALAGYGLGRHRADDHAVSALTNTRPATPTFLLLFHVDSSFRRGHTPAASAAILADYGRWADRLTREGTLVGGEKLADSTAWFGSAPETSATGDHLAGFMVIRAKDRAAAADIAATCPHLKYGGRIELRMISTS